MKKENINRVLEIGVKVLSCKGYHNFGLREVLENANIPSGSFYYYFKSKEDFAVKVLEYYGEKVASYFKSKLLDGKETYAKRLNVIFTEEIERLNQTNFTQGCIIGNLASEVAGQNKLIQETSDINYNKWQDIFKRFFEEGRENNEFSEDINAESLAMFFLSSRQGALTRTKSSRSIEPYELFRLYMTNIILK